MKIIIAALICCSLITHTMEEGSSSTAPQTATVKKTKKKQQFDPHVTDPDPNRKIPTPSAAYQREYHQLEQDLIHQQLEAAHAQKASIPPQQALLKFAQETLPEVQEIIKTCTNDLVSIWNIFSAIPSDEQAAQKAFETIQLRKKSYILNTGIILPDYGRLLQEYLHAAFYSSRGVTVDELDDLLDSATGTIHTNAKALYEQSNKVIFDAAFNNVTGDSDYEKYAQAVQDGKALLNDYNKKIERVENAFTSSQSARTYSYLDYLNIIAAKRKAEREIVIQRVLPYVQKIGLKQKDLEAALRASY